MEVARRAKSVNESGADVAAMAKRVWKKDAMEPTTKIGPMSFPKKNRRIAARMVVGTASNSSSLMALFSAIVAVAEDEDDISSSWSKDTPPEVDMGGSASADDDREANTGPFMQSTRDPPVSNLVASPAADDGSRDDGDFVGDNLGRVNAVTFPWRLPNKTALKSIECDDFMRIIYVLG